MTFTSVIYPTAKAWSSLRHHADGETRSVEIESHWTARKSERAGIPSTPLRASFSCGAGAETPCCEAALFGASPSVLG